LTEEFKFTSLFLGSFFLGDCKKMNEEK